MKILITGKGSSGSWKCRGEQLGGEVGRVVPKASLRECKAADVIVVVKRLHPSFFRNMLASGKPWIWDLVDFYPQPLCAAWNRQQAISWVHAQIDRAKPSWLIYPNQRMADDIGLPGTVIYHHAKPWITPRCPKAEIKTVGYEGAEYLGKWRPALEKECAQRGWQFRTDLPVEQIDIAVAFRDGVHAGYCQRKWKSNVKLANAHAAGVPFIGNPDAAYLETGTDDEIFIKHPDELGYAFDLLTPIEVRERIHDSFTKHAVRLLDVAQQLRGVCSACAQGTESLNLMITSQEKNDGKPTP